MLHLDHYGLHRTEGDIALLIQQDRVDHILGVHFAVAVQVRQRRPCSHRIDLTLGAYHALLADRVDDALFQAMLPIPHGDGSRPLFMEDTANNRALVQRLAKLTSPGSFSIMFPVWMAKPDWLRETNIQPLVVHGVKMESVKQLERLLVAGTYSPRRLIVLGERTTILGDRADRVSTTLTAEALQDINLEAVGAYALRQHMQGNPTYADE